MLRDTFRKLPLLREANAYLKCAAARRRYQATISRYALRGPAPLAEAWRARARTAAAAWRSNRARVFFLGTDEQQDKSGFLQALQAKADVRWFDREGGAWGQNDPAPYEERLARNTARLEALFERNAQQGWTPDLLLGQTWGCLLEPACFSRLRARYGIFAINVAMDDRHQYWGQRVGGRWDGTYPLIPHLDLTLTAAPEAVHWYRCEGGAALYFPEASDPAVFAVQAALPKRHDISFVGSRYGMRADVVHALRHAGMAVAAFGGGWEGGRIDTAQVPVLFAQSKIVLGVSAIGHCRDFVALKLRDFDVPMSGACYLTQYNKDLESLYQLGDEILTYRNIDDCVAQARMVLSDPARWAAVGAAGHRRAVADHTWSKRLDDMFDVLADPRSL